MKYIILFVAIALTSIPCAIANDYRGKTVEELKIAFARDGFEVVKEVSFEGKIGLMAEHKTAFHYERKIPKRAYYIEGKAYQMGYLLGLMGEDHLEKMSTDFIDKLIFDYIHIDFDPKKGFPELWKILKGAAIEITEKIRPDIPEVYMQEMRGLVDGARQANPETQVTLESLVLLNVGIDALFSRLYALNKLPIFDPKTGEPIDPGNFKIPIACNAFSVFGKATIDGKHYFGRDFMFPTSGIFDYAAAMTVYRPEDGRIPMVAVHAPGMVGVPATMNIEGVGGGVDVVMGNNCNPKRPGINSLLMVRTIGDYGDSARKALDKVIETQRGVTWLYFIADGKNDEAVVAETGAKMDKPDLMKYIPEELKNLKLLPDQDFLDRYETVEYRQGVMARWHDYQYPQEFLTFNQRLFAHFGKKQSAKSWGERGFINPTWEDKNCPQLYYFSPQRENREDVLILANQYTIPTMGMCSMHPMTTMFAQMLQDKQQWRYDELNNQILENYGKIDEAKAIELIDFLNVHGKYPGFYKDLRYSSDKTTQEVYGSISLCNLTDRVIHTLVGYYKDDWTTITLPNYVAKE